MELYQQDPYCQSIATTIAATTFVKKRPAVMVERNILYPGGGGQPFDRGSLLAGGAEVPIERAVRVGGQVFLVLAGPAELDAGQEVELRLDWPRRYAHMRCHSGSHVLMGAVKRRLSDYVAKGIDIQDGGRACTIRFEGAWQPAPREAQAFIEQSNQVIAENRAIEVVEFADLGQAIAQAREIYRGPRDMLGAVSIVTVAGWDANPCGGTHVRATGEIGPLRLAGCEASKVRFEID